MTIQEAYLEAVLLRAARNRRDVIEDAIAENEFRRRLRHESPAPLNREHALKRIPRRQPNGR